MRSAGSRRSRKRATRDTAQRVLGKLSRRATEAELELMKSYRQFSSWRQEVPVGSSESYTKQIYNNGQRCWNGPDRSALVDLVCGTSNAILSVSEP